MALTSGSVVPGVAAHGDVFVDGQIFEDAPALHDLEDAAPDDDLGCQSLDALAEELDLPVGDLALLRVEQARDGLEGRALAGAVGPEERDDPPLGHLERQALQDEDHIVVDDLDVGEPEHP